MRSAPADSAILTRAPAGKRLRRAVALDGDAAVEGDADASAGRGCPRVSVASQKLVSPMKPATKARLRGLVEIVRRADLLQLAMVEHGDAIGHGQRFGLVMRDEHDRDADLALQMLRLDLHLLAQILVERRQRLVHQQHARPVDDGARDRDALLLAARQLRGLAFAEAVEPDRCERGARLLLALGARRRLRIFSGKAMFSSTDMCGNSV